MTKILSPRDCVLTADSQVSCGFRFVMSCEGYFRLFDYKAAPVISEQQRVITADREKITVTMPCWATTLKVLSYSFLIIPIVAGSTVLIGRKRYTCHCADGLHKRTTSGGGRWGGQPYTPKPQKGGDTDPQKRSFEFSTT